MHTKSQNYVGLNILTKITIICNKLAIDLLTVQNMRIHGTFKNLYIVCEHRMGIRILF